MRYSVQFCDKLPFPFQFCVVDNETGLVDKTLGGSKAYFMSKDKAEDYAYIANMTTKVKPVVPYEGK
jgi:hypothetical protein